MGERDNLLAMFLSAQSIGELLEIYDFYDMIMDQDKTVLDAYRSEYAKHSGNETAA